MGTLAFFPWMTVAERVQIGDVTLTPYELPNEPSGGDPVSKILSTFKEMNRNAIKSATIVQLTGRQLTGDLTEDEMDRIFTHAEALSFFGLSTRRFFDHFGYCNRDSFQCVVQRFTDANFIAIVARRRDGELKNGIRTDLYQVAREPHVHELRSYTVDGKFVDAVIKGMSQDPDFDLAIRHFGNANTDRPGLGPADEMVSTVSAFQRLLKIKSGDTDATRAAFLMALEEIPAREPIANRREIRSEKLAKRTGMRDIWMEDLCVVRGNLAHGKRENAHPAYWSRQEHLLLAAFIFPLVAKLRLRDLGLYRLTDDDDFALLSIDHLISAKVLFKVREDDHGLPIYGWDEAFMVPRKEQRRAAMRRVFEKLGQY